jgi:uncharacterized membrane protein
VGLAQVRRAVRGCAVRTREWPVEEMRMDQKEINKAEWSNPENWSGGLYFSKRDSRTWVPKPIPWMGWTLNLATRAGACWMLGFLIGLPVLIILVMGLAIGE